MNQLDFEDAILRGKKRGSEAARRVVEKWHRPEVETLIGQVVQRVAADPGLKDMQSPAAMREMEARYGKG